MIGMRLSTRVWRSSVSSGLCRDGWGSSMASSMSKSKWSVSPVGMSGVLRSYIQSSNSSAWVQL